MGLLSSIGGFLFGDPSDDIGRASEQNLAYQREGLDYLKQINALPLEIRNQVLPILQGFYTGDQSGLIEDVQSSPFYQQMIEAGQEGVLDRAGAMGLTRSGNTAVDLSRSNQAVLQNLVNQRLGGLQGLASMPINAAGVANQYNLMGQNVGQAGIAQANAQQQLGGQALSGILGAIGAFSDRRLKKDIKLIGKNGRHNIYKWRWNEIANDEFNLWGESQGVIAQEVEQYAPELISHYEGYKRVDYEGLRNG